MAVTVTRIRAAVTGVPPKFSRLKIRTALKARGMNNDEAATRRLRTSCVISLRAMANIAGSSCGGRVGREDV